MALSPSPNSLLDIKPNRFYKARLRNVRWDLSMQKISDDSGNSGDNSLAGDKDTLTNIISTSNETASRIRDRYNK